MSAETFWSEYRSEVRARWSAVAPWSRGLLIWSLGWVSGCAFCGLLVTWTQ